MLDSLLLFDLCQSSYWLLLLFNTRTFLDRWMKSYSFAFAYSNQNFCFLNHCSYIIVPHWVGHLLLFNNIFKKCEITCSLMPLILKLHFHVKSIRYFSNGRYKLATFWMIIQWTRSNLHKESFRVRTTNTIINNTLFEPLRKTTINNWHRFSRH